jgi:flavin reductase (DIM6/NTAB) family NADH-FMN oxidoreductase RutF
MEQKLHTISDFEKMDTRFRANFFNSIIGFKSAVLVGTQSAKGRDNVAVFSSLFHMGSNPPLFGMLFRPSGEVERHTLANIEDTGFYTLNNILSSFAEKAHQTSAKYGREVSEFDACGLGRTFIPDFKPPFVTESNIRLGMAWLESIPIIHNGTTLVIGKVLYADVPDEVVEKDGYVDIENAGTVAVSGLDSYHLGQRVARFPFARP